MAHRPQRNRIAKYLLRQWHYFDTHIDFLRPAEFRNMKILYVSLDKMSEDELKLLADKYRVDSSYPVRDDVMAKRQGLTPKEYRHKRIATEEKLLPILLKNAEQYKLDWQY